MSSATIILGNQLFPLSEIKKEIGSNIFMAKATIWLAFQIP